MTRKELHNKIGSLLYIEDFGMIDIILASIVANSLKVGNPVWLTLIGPSSGGKSQIIKPLATAHPQMITQMDDLTSNTLLSGSLGLDGSLLGRIGEHGIISMDDLTVLFSKSPEQRAEILSQFRMLYGGRFAKSSGSKKEEIVWEGYLGMIAGSTPSIYKHFSEVADMGERFISYRMRDYDRKKAALFVRNNTIPSHELDAELSAIFSEYLLEILPAVAALKDIELPDAVKDQIQNTSELTTWLRTPVSINDRTEAVDEFPILEMPFRVMKQLNSVAISMYAMELHDNPEATVLPEDLSIALDWCGYSMANDKRRTFLKYMVGIHDLQGHIDNKAISICSGLPEVTVGRSIQQLQALDIVRSKGDGRWGLCSSEMNQLVRRLDPAPKDLSDRL